MNNNYYTDRFFKRRIKKYHAEEIKYAKAIYNIFHPHSVVDVGCAIGSYLYGFSLCGINTSNLCGYEKFARLSRKYAENSIRNRIYELDASLLRTPRTRYELVTCVEVAEHIETTSARNLVSNLVGLKKLNCGRIFFTAAGIGQPGTGHINCQPQEFWIDLFDAHDLTLDLEGLDLASSAINTIGDSLNILKNLMIFKNPRTI